MKISYTTFSPLELSAQPSILNECAKLYSEHYGIWSFNNPTLPLRGKNIKLSSRKLAEWLNNNSSYLYIAQNENKEIIGYAIAFNAIPEKKKIKIAWVSQLVVHKNYRNSDVAKNLLYSIWGESKNYAWGIISANPYAVRALEKATRRRCRPICISRDIKTIFSICSEYLPYVKASTKFSVNDNTSVINTEFYVDHTDIPNMIKNVTDTKTPWLLGELSEGFEWIGVTFNRQEQIKLSATEIKNMIETSDMVTKKAYSRMLISNNQKWMNHTANEVDYMIKNLGINSSSIIYDFGCGIGRHVIEFTKRGLTAFGIDYLDCNIEAAQKQAQEEGFDGNHLFKLGDCKDISLNNNADAIICIYDVIGSFVDEESNEKIIRNISANLKFGGKALISVMNFEMTNHIATQIFSFEKEPNKLLQLKASQTMENTGDIFNPDYFMVDRDTHIIYRKERFEQGGLPTELLVRDRRFTKDEICELCEKYKLHVENANYVNASDWNNYLTPFNIRAKEILITCTKV